jgi:hypothetical protein
MSIERLANQLSPQAPRAAEASATPAAKATSTQGLSSLFTDGVDRSARPGLVRSAPVPPTSQAQQVTSRVHEVAGQDRIASNPMVSGLLQAAQAVWIRGLRKVFTRLRRKKLLREVRRGASAQKTPEGHSRQLDDN